MLQKVSLGPERSAADPNQSLTYHETDVPPLGRFHVRTDHLLQSRNTIPSPEKTGLDTWLMLKKTPLPEINP